MKEPKTIEGATLRKHRLALKYSQMDVAVRAEIETRQYQRLEYGERNMSSASMRVGLAICAVLKIDPYQLIFGDGENDFFDKR